MCSWGVGKQNKPKNPKYKYTRFGTHESMVIAGQQAYTYATYALTVKRLNLWTTYRKKKYSWGISEWKFVKTTTNIRQWGSSAFSCQEIMFKILQDRYYGLDSKQKLYNAAKGEKILLDDNSLFYYLL